MSGDLPTIEDSEVLIAKILDRLARSGVKNQQISVQDIFGESYTAKEIAHFDDAIRWLFNEGVIRYNPNATLSDNSDPYVLHYEAVVTAYGFQLLSSKLSDGLLAGTAVKSVAEGGTGYAKTGELVGGLLGALYKSAMS